ncbi:excitatory amino acid transporter 1-like [Venturia canescens]|uniref:excitatory amino acid transporter 1-like n=1 Tax=Venturia canescens TaxID=32260 RepID=UPI001C9BEBA6|nr:excitatory amino acid transporter 1-like [Venturia canescens]XP_043283247.1 excitatory amino acid transporter 1-like [Venturia canescens]XP_043283248.1 excitatory amino acid transporter 1-like [Venturia canescens]XP_043283249.1 excitatory amino acid transporter 1-like [Venturia canescens]XP_043283250.1 excitatory amino acid transporter 1-like [Venturia canescens]XP_043283251.1 excitatory amino acid transporter 1-like [Venturia canescens]
MEAASELSPLSGADSQVRVSERTSYYPQEPSKRPQTKGQKVQSFLKHNALTILTVSGVAGGVVLGLILRHVREEPWTKREIMYVNYVGELFLRMLKSLILPLIVASLISAIGSLDLSLSSKIGARAITYYMVTTVSAVILGIILVVVIHPGRGDSTGMKEQGNARNVSTTDTLMDLVRNMFPPNLVQACISQYRTVLTKQKNNTSDDILTWEISGEDTSGLNILGLVVFATVLGITLGKMGPSGKPLLSFFEALSSAMMIITNWVIWLSPVGVLFLVASKIMEMESFDVILGQLGMYFMTVLIGLFIHGFIVLPTIFFLFTKKNPIVYISNMAQAIATAFGTSSSSATLPVAIGCLEERNGIDSRVSRFVMPIGATINMDGTALYEAVAAIFIAQVRNFPLSFGQLAAVSITATAASIGAAGIPQAGLVTMVMVLDTVGLPAKDVTLIVAVDWLLDRFRTSVNVVGDSLGAGIVNHLSRHELASLPHNAQSQNGADHHTTSI